MATEEKKYSIVGVDPGTTAGICVLSLDGKLRAMASIRNAGIEGIVRYILGHGTPSLIAFDKKIASDVVAQIASSFNVSLYTPEYDIREEEKAQAAAPFKPEDAHERDACASAIGAFRYYQNKFRHIDSLGLSEAQKSKAKHMVLNGVKLSDVMENFSTANEITSIKEDLTHHGSSDKVPASLSSRLDKMAETVNRIAEENMELRKLAGRLERENQALAWKLKSFKIDVKKEVSKDEEVVFLRRQLAGMNETVKNLSTRIKRLQRNLKEESYGQRHAPVQKSSQEKLSKPSSEEGGKDLKVLLEDIIAEYRRKRTKEIGNK